MMNIISNAETILKDTKEMVDKFYIQQLLILEEVLLKNQENSQSHVKIHATFDLGGFERYVIEDIAPWTGDDSSKHAAISCLNMGLENGQWGGDFFTKIVECAQESSNTDVISEALRDFGVKEKSFSGIKVHDDYVEISTSNRNISHTRAYFLTTSSISKSFYDKIKDEYISKNTLKM